MEVAEAFAGFTARRGRRAAPGDEPQALRGALERHRERFVARRDAPRRRRRARPPSACGRWSRASPASASPRRTAPPSACSPTSRRGCACTTDRSSCARCSTSSRWASTPPTASCTRPSSRGIAVLRPRRQRLGGASARCRTARVRLGLGYVKGVAEAEVQALVAERERGGPFASLGDLAARAGARAQDARAAGLVGRLRRARSATTRQALGAVAAGSRRARADGRRRGHAARAAAGAAARRRACARSGAGSG